MSGATLVLFMALAQTPQFAPAPEVHEQNDEVYAIGSVLRCPVCQGMPIAESPSSMAQDMMKRVREMHDEGQTRQQILDYFVSRYGEWVLLEPKHRGFGLLVWALPPLGLFMAVVLALVWIRRRPRTSGPSHDEPTNPGGVIVRAGDSYVEAIRREVQD